MKKYVICLLIALMATLTLSAGANAKSGQFSEKQNKMTYKEGMSKAERKAGHSFYNKIFKATQKAIKTGKNQTIRVTKKEFQASGDIRIQPYYDKLVREHYGIEEWAAAFMGEHYFSYSEVSYNFNNYLKEGKQVKAGNSMVIKRYTVIARIARRAEKDALAMDELVRIFRQEFAESGATTEREKAWFTAKWVSRRMKYGTYLEGCSPSLLLAGKAGGRCGSFAQLYECFMSVAGVKKFGGCVTDDHEFCYVMEDGVKYYFDWSLLQDRTEGEFYNKVTSEYLAGDPDYFADTALAKQARATAEEMLSYGSEANYYLRSSLEEYSEMGGVIGSGKVHYSKPTKGTGEPPVEYWARYYSH